MKLISFLYKGQEQVGVYKYDKAFPLNTLDASLPLTMKHLLENWDLFLPVASRVISQLESDSSRQNNGIQFLDVQLLAPVTRPNSCRDGYAFRQHVASARKNRGLGMIPQFDEYPIFYFTNHMTVQGPGEVVCMPDHFEKLDYELEVAVVINRKGKNIRAKDADSYIGGFMIMNDLSARTLQMEEMLLNLGPAKGKDFATSNGPWLVTPDELQKFETACKPGHTGKAWNLEMSALVNGEKLSSGNLADMDWTFAEIIERCSYGVELNPGDVIGSGTVGTGCLLELNGTGKLNAPDFKERWLMPGDEVVLKVEGLGELKNTMIRDASDFSILKQKKTRPSS